MTNENNYLVEINKKQALEWIIQKTKEKIIAIDALIDIQNSREIPSDKQLAKLMLELECSRFTLLRLQP